MTLLIDTLNISHSESTSAPNRSVFMPASNLTLSYESLCVYCKDNNISLDKVSAEDFEACAAAIESSGENGFWFWFD